MLKIIWNYFENYFENYLKLFEKLLISLWKISKTKNIKYQPNWDFNNKWIVDNKSVTLHDLTIIISLIKKHFISKYLEKEVETWKKKQYMLKYILTEYYWYITTNVKKVSQWGYDYCILWYHFHSERLQSS